MKIFDKIMNLFRPQKVEEIELEVAPVYKWQTVNFHDDVERSRYIMDALEQITTATNELNHITRELQVVDAYLHDMEEIERLPKNEADSLKEIAKQILGQRKKAQKYENRKDKLKEHRYYQFEQQEKEIIPALDKLKEAEQYQNLIKQDMKRLEGESHSYRYRRNELITLQSNLKGVLAISLGAVLICSILLWILQALFAMEIQIGFLLLLFVFAIALTLIYIQNSNATRELGRVNKDINRLIQLQNTVKIRYVNNANLLEYMYMKFNVDSAKKLNGLWNCYIKEKEEHRKMADNEANLAFYEQQLIQQLVRLRIRIPDNWLLKTAAIVDIKEMGNAKDEMLHRRQALKNQVDYNQSIGENAKNEILEIAAHYPMYAKELQMMVDDYEKKTE